MIAYLHGSAAMSSLLVMVSFSPDKTAEPLALQAAIVNNRLSLLPFQSQACIMLTPRMPLYIPLVYNVFLYTSTVAAWRLNLRPLAEAALTGLMGEMIYAPYDVTGEK